MRKIDLSRTLPNARIAELPNPYFGKVRDCYDLPDGTRLLISSDRISAFDQILAVIPWKGQVLTQLYPDFDSRSYGSARLSDLLKRTGRFDVQKGEGNHLIVRDKA